MLNTAVNNSSTGLIASEIDSEAVGTISLALSYQTRPKVFAFENPSCLALTPSRKFHDG
jgi:hypothetical protein